MTYTASILREYGFASSQIRTCRRLPPLRNGERIDKWSTSEIKKRGSDGFFERLNSMGFALAMDNEPNRAFYSKRTILHPHIIVEQVGKLDDENQYIRIPKELSFSSRYVFVQTLKDSSLLIRQMPKDFEREQEKQNGEDFADHLIHTLLIPLFEARERKKAQAKNEKP